ncbi:MAG: MFS transporter [Dehalococcoidia bacterium]
MAQPSQAGRWFELFAVLRYRDFRLFWSGLVMQIIGQQMMLVTIGWLTFHLTGSALTLGIINLLGAAPRLLLMLAGGVLADRVDQRTLIIISQGLSAFFLAILGVLTITERIEVWHLALASVLIGLVQAFDEPSRQSLFPRLLPDRSHIPAAVPLISMAWSFNRILAPSIAGFAIAAWGAGVSFLISMGGAALMVCMMRLLSLSRVPATQRGNMLRSLVEGTSYVWRNNVFRAVIALSFFNALFVMGYPFMLPVFQVEVFDVDARGLGLLYAAPGVGAICGLLTYTQLARRFRAGRMIVSSVIAFAALVLAFAMAGWFPLALLLLGCAGYAHTLNITSSQVALQMLVPDELRGRVMALYGMLWTLMPIGGAVLNAVASFTSAPAALGMGAVLVLSAACVVTVRAHALRNLRVERTAAA